MATTYYDLSTWQGTSTTYFPSFINSAFGESDSNMTKIDTAIHDVAVNAVQVVIPSANTVGTSSTSYTVSITNLSQGKLIAFVSTATNTGSVTLVNSSTTINVMKLGPSNSLINLVTNDIINAIVYLMVYDGNGNFILYPQSIGNATTYGNVILSDSVSSTSAASSGTAASPYAVKTAYDLANSALPKSGGTMTGDLISDNPAIGTSAVRNIIASTTDLTAGSSALTTGSVYLVYE